ncbi:MAG: hypothetical protein K2P81_17405 [Bacteriovoracaceae bacterium]|nr:hypothetical protein [Bacteriovoracaceae bacterium]
MRNLLVILILSILTSCLPQESIPTSSSLYVSAGDILVSSSTTDTLHQLDSEGNYIRALWRTTLATESISSIGWMASTNEILITVNGTPDRVVAVSVVNGTERVLINNTNITGTVNSAIQVVNSNAILVSELTTIERTNDLGLRETYAGVWPSSVTTNIQCMAPMANGGFATASSSIGLKTFDDSIVAFAALSTAAIPAGTTGSYGIVELANGNFLASWEGAATDYLSIYDSNLNLVQHIFGNNQGVLATPRGVGQMKNGHYLVADNTLDYVLEINSSGSVVNTLGVGGVLDGAYGILVVPDFSP